VVNFVQKPVVPSWMRHALTAALLFVVLVLVLIFIAPRKAQAYSAIEYLPGAVTGNTGLSAQAGSGGPCTTSSATCTVVEFIMPSNQTALSLDFWATGGTFVSPGTWSPALNLTDSSNNVLTALTCTGSATGEVNAAQWAQVHCTLGTEQALSASSTYKVRGNFGTRKDTNPATVYARGQTTSQGAPTTGCELQRTGCLARGYPGILTVDSIAPYDPYSCYTSDGCPMNFLLNTDPRDAPTATWTSWPDGQVSDAATFNQTRWRVTSNVDADDYPGEDVGFYIALYKGSSTSSAQLVYLSNRIGSNTVYSTEGFYAINISPEYVHNTTSTQQYFIQVAAEVGNTLGEFSDPIDYFVSIDQGGLPPESNCPGDAPFYTSCFWVNLAVQLFVPSSNSLAAMEYQEAVSSTAAKAPFVYLYQVITEFGQMEPITSTSLSFNVNISVGNTPIPFTVPLKTTSTPWTATYDNYVMPLLSVAVYLALILYLYERVKHIHL